MLGLAKDQATLETPDAVDRVRGRAHEPLSHLLGLLEPTLAFFNHLPTTNLPHRYQPSTYYLPGFVLADLSSSFLPSHPTTSLKKDLDQNHHLTMFSKDAG